MRKKNKRRQIVNKTLPSMGKQLGSVFYVLFNLKQTQTQNRWPEELPMSQEQVWATGRGTFFNLGNEVNWESQKELNRSTKGTFKAEVSIFFAVFSSLGKLCSFIIIIKYKIQFNWKQNIHNSNGKKQKQARFFSDSIQQATIREWERVARAFASGGCLCK